MLLRRHQVHVIHNAFPADYYSPDALPADGSDPLAELRGCRAEVVMCAARIDDTIKGLPYAIDALNYIFDNYPDIARRMTVIFVGELRDPNALDTLRMPSISLGRVNDPPSCAASTATRRWCSQRRSTKLSEAPSSKASRWDASP